MARHGCSWENSSQLLSDDSFFAQVMESERSIDFQKDFFGTSGQNEASQQTQASKESSVAANKLNDIPETLEEVKNHLGDGAVRNITERIKEAETKEEKQSNDVGRASPKWESENNEKQNGEKEATKLRSGNPLTLAPLSHIPLNTVMHVEMELVYADEQEIAFEFAVPAALHGRADATSAATSSAVPRVDERLWAALQEASRHYRQKNYAVAAGRFATALELCSKGAAIDKSSKPFPEDISSIASFIEMKLVTCYLKLRKPDLALNHSHRSIILNPAYFRNHLCQAAVFRWLERYSEAARSAMIADYMYWLTGGTEQRISKLIKLYWQAMIEEAITREESFSVMYTPFVTKVKVDNRDKMTDAFTKMHPGYTQHIFTDPHGLHILPQTTEWSSSPPQQYLLTLGFRNKQIGKILEKLPSRKLPIFSDCKAPFSPIPEDELRRQWETIGKQIMPVMDFMRSTKLTDDVCACSRAIEKLHYASILGRLQQVTEQSQVINQAMAELASIPYLQDISQQDAELLQSLMADAMDTLEGRRSDKERVWNEIEKIAIIVDFIYQTEDSYLKNKKRRAAKRERRKMKKLQSAEQHQSPGSTKLSLTSPKDMATQPVRELAP
ncbi:spermatogenesis-associated protein 16 isoform X1 [Gallus gallus]|uniref:spermatogenesis-associated protein 16 isoform X1 n=2 Tax=Gallus gallus TaxID=9031 RepID=UPI001AEB60E5|nr:spermatogenesis-associated protein 16 isoform X1 [Gallus gallus]